MKLADTTLIPAHAYVYGRYRPVNCFRGVLVIVSCLWALCAWSLEREDVLALVDAREAEAVALATEIFEFAELGYLETRSSARLAGYLRGEGFEVTQGVAGIPTAFLAESGRGGPVIAFLAEFDALPGLSQAPVPERKSLGGDAGHACGHHLFGSASVTAAAAVAEWLASAGHEGRVRVYGTPAEEGGSGKVYMVREGLFADVDIVLHWHPSDRNDASPASSNSNKSGRFRFHGIAAHAATAPERGRSALDAVEAMNHMTNLMREHMPQEARLHYVITEGGEAPNIVPELAEVYYYVRHPQTAQVKALFERVVKAAEGAALGTGTRMEYEVMHGNFPLLPNDLLSGLVYEQLVNQGGYVYSANEQIFAEKIRESLPAGAQLGLESTNEIQAFAFKQGMGSTDVGDVSWAAPTAGLRTATWVPGTAAHSWQAVAAGGMGIGHKGMKLAAEVLALTAQKLIQNPVLVEQAREELLERRGDGFKYVPLLGDRAPPLDYRVSR